MPPLGGPSLALETRLTIGRIAYQRGQPDLKGINITHVAKQFNITTKTARKWLQEGLKQRPDFADKPRSGRPPKLAQQQKNSIRRHATHRDTSRQIKERLERLHGVQVSLSTIARVLGSGRNPLSWRAIKRGKVLSPINIQKRLQFAKQHLGDDFKKWVFLDQFDDYPSYEKDGSASECWQSDKSQPAPALGTIWSFRMYTAVGWDFKTPLFFTAPSPQEGTHDHKSKETFTAKHFIGLMEQMKPYLDQRYPTGDYVIIRDKAPQHTAKVSKKATEEMGLPILNDYTAQSWDKNIIENVWGVLRNKLRGAKAKCTDGWYSTYREAWGSVKQSSINKLVSGMPARLESIIEAEGMWVSHH